MVAKKHTKKRARSDRDLLEYLITTVSKQEKTTEGLRKDFRDLQKAVSAVQLYQIRMREDIRDIKDTLRDMPTLMLDEVDRVYEQLLNEHEDRIRTLERTR